MNVFRLQRCGREVFLFRGIWISLGFCVCSFWRDFHEAVWQPSRFWTHFDVSRGFRCLAVSEKGIDLRWKLTAGLYIAGLRFLSYDEAPSRQLGDKSVWTCDLIILTIVQLSEDVDARLIVDVACRRGQELNSVLEKRKIFDLMLIKAGTNDLTMGVAPNMMLHDVQALHEECQMGVVRTVDLRVSQRFFNFRRCRCPQWWSELQLGRSYDSTYGLWKSDGLHFSKADF